MERTGYLNDIAMAGKYDRHRLRRALNEALAAASGASARLVDLPGVASKADLPADPLTRLFFQTKGEYALYQQTYVDPAKLDQDRIQIATREGARKDQHIRVKTPIFDFCHRLREASEQRKRFVIVPSTHETRGAAQVLLQHGLVAGFRDFNNNRAFAVELKYFQNEPTINTIEPCSFDGRAEFIWSPKMMRRLMNHYGMHNKLVIYICRTHDGRVIDHIQAVREQIGGKGLLMCF
jgi:ribosomal protein S8